MYTKFIPKIIQEKLKAKERALGYAKSIANEPAFSEGAIKPKDMQSRSTFVRMCSNKLSVPNKIISGGELKLKFNSENSLVSGMLFGKELYQRRRNNQIRPISGLKSIEVSYKGSFKAIREATVNWIAASIDDLEELTPYFLTVGKTIALDWGWVNSNATRAKMFNNQDPFITYDAFLDQWNVNQDIFNNPQDKIQRAGGDYDALAGKVSNFEMTLRQDGGFDCVTKVTAIGAALFQKPIDKPSNQVQMESSSKGRKIAYDSDNIVNAIINLKGVILSTAFGRKIDVNSDKKFPSSGNVDNLDERNIVYQEDKHGIAVDTKVNPNVLWLKQPTKEDIFVKWAWMEDQLLNRYVALKGGEDNDIKMTIRSIDTVLDGDNLPILTKTRVEELDRTAEENIQSRVRGNTEAASSYTSGDETYVVQSGDNLSTIARNNNTSVEALKVINNISNADVLSVGQEIKLPANIEPPPASSQQTSQSQNSVDEDVSDIYELKGLSSTGKFLKTPTLIKNVKRFLKPIYPYKFFSVELLPSFKEINQLPSDTASGVVRYFYDVWADWSGDQSSGFKPFWNALKDLEDKQFTKTGNEGLGRLRYMWVNIEEIQTAFGITFTEEGTVPAVSPKGTVEKGLKSLLSQLNRNFYDFWNFELTVDPYDPSNVKVIDTKATDISSDNMKYTKYESNNHKVSSMGIYKFPAFTVGSMVKNQNLNFKIPDSMAITILYGNNKSDKTNETSFSFNNPDMMKLFGRNSGLVDEDRYLDSITTPGITNDETKKTFSKVGSEMVNHNSKIVVGQGVDIQPSSWWQQWVGENKVVFQNPKEKNRPPNASFFIDPDNDQIVYMRENSILYDTELKLYTNATGYTEDDKIAIKAGVETVEVNMKNAIANQFNQGGNRNVTNTNPQQ